MHHTYDTLNKALEQLKTALAQKEAENDALRAKVYEWKKRALAQEALNQQQIESHRERELQLIADHQAHIDALTSAHVDKMNSLSDNIICLQNAYEAQIAGANEPLVILVAQAESKKIKA
ncbi:hypothetical protein BC940DRAFT_289320 [Gongronella butleri]|nr:hypothetical protein BC940DRAFT_289320 [Gongronella butleri]